MGGVVFDSTFLIDLLNPKTSGDQRISLDYLIEVLSQQRNRILVPSPCFTELLIHAGEARDSYVQQFSSSSNFEIITFDRRAATECAILLSDAWDKKTKKAITRTKFKFDWMIVACAASRGVQTIYSDDDDIARCAAERGIQTIKQTQLNFPDEARQLPIPNLPSA
jgi:predicted nucleic acid-binding protein